MADLFLDKNKDYVVAEHQDLLTASKCSFAAGLFPPSPEESSKSSKFSSIGSRFKVLPNFSSTYIAILSFVQSISKVLVVNWTLEGFRHKVQGLRRLAEYSTCFILLDDKHVWLITMFLQKMHCRFSAYVHLLGCMVHITIFL